MTFRKSPSIAKLKPPNIVKSNSHDLSESKLSSMSRSISPSSFAKMKLPPISRMFDDLQPHSKDILSASDQFFKGQCSFAWRTQSLEALPPPMYPEYIFLGRSNVGKSTLLNALMSRNKKNIARASKTPGSTKALTGYSISTQLYLVDSPGYGYKSRADWGTLIMDYLKSRRCLKRAIVLVDGSLPEVEIFKSTDDALIQELARCGIPFQVVLTKFDKILPKLYEVRLAMAETHLRKIGRGAVWGEVIGVGSTSHSKAGYENLRASLLVGAGLASSKKVLHIKSRGTTTSKATIETLASSSHTKINPKNDTRMSKNSPETRARALTTRGGISSSTVNKHEKGHYIASEPARRPHRLLTPASVQVDRDLGSQRHRHNHPARSGKENNSREKRKLLHQTTGRNTYTRSPLIAASRHTNSKGRGIGRLSRSRSYTTSSQVVSIHANTSIQSVLHHVKLQSLQDYQQVGDLQERLVRHMLDFKSGKTTSAPMPTVLTMQLKNVYTLGRRDTTTSSIYQQLASTGSQVVKSLRGGQTTFHGPGQLVAYPILDILALSRPLTPRCYVDLLEQSIIDTLAEIGTVGMRTSDTGVWMYTSIGKEKEKRKIAAIGVHLRRNITSHGIALNISTDLKRFDQIPGGGCGLAGLKSTSLEAEGFQASFEDVEAVFVSKLAKLLNMRVQMTSEEACKG